MPLPPALAALAARDRALLGIVMLAPAPAREGLAALLVLEETLGAIPLPADGAPSGGLLRFAWWREALADPARLPPGEATGPLAEAAARHALPAAPLVALAGAMEVLAGQPGFADTEAALAFTEAAAAPLVALLSSVLGREPAPGLARLWAVERLTRRLARLPEEMARRRSALPQSCLAAEGSSLARMMDFGPDARVRAGLLRFAGELGAALPAARLPPPLGLALVPARRRLKRLTAAGGDPASLARPDGLLPAALLLAHWRG